MSTQKTTLAELQYRTEQRDIENHDDVISVSRMRFENAQTMRIDDDRYALTRHATGQIAQRLGVPGNYLHACPPELQAQNLNHWLQQEAKERDNFFVRFQHGSEIRAIFTERYRKIDNSQIVNALTRRYSGDTPVEYSLDDNSFIALIPGGDGYAIRPGDEVARGVSIANSETGFKALTVAPWEMRLICCNGMVMTRGTNFSRRHVGRTDLFQAIHHAETSAPSLRENWQRSREIGIKPDEELANIKTQNRLTHNQGEALNWGFEAEPGSTAFHLINAVTKAAQHESLMPQEVWQLQDLGGRLLQAA